MLFTKNYKKRYELHFVGRINILYSLCAKAAPLISFYRLYGGKNEYVTYKLLWIITQWWDTEGFGIENFDFAFYGFCLIKRSTRIIYYFKCTIIYNFKCIQTNAELSRTGADSPVVVHRKTSTTEEFIQIKSIRNQG